MHLGNSSIGYSSQSIWYIVRQNEMRIPCFASLGKIVSVKLDIFKVKAAFLYVLSLNLFVFFQHYYNHPIVKWNIDK